MIALCAPKPIKSNQRIAFAARLKRADLIENIEHLLRFNCGEAEILRMAGKHPEALKTQLRRTRRQDLIPRIFEYDATLYDRRIEQ